MKFQTLWNGKLAVRGNRAMVVPGNTVDVMALDGCYSVTLGKCIHENVQLVSEIINICLVKSKTRKAMQ